MKKWVLAAAAAVGLAGSASAAVITLESITPQGGGQFSFNYQGTLGPDEGVRPGDRLVVFDFGGYVPGSIFTPNANVVGSVEFTSPTALVTPGFTDNPNIVNLVFTYVGAPFRNEGGPFTPFDFNGLGARSTLSRTAIDAFFTLTTKNNPRNDENTARSGASAGGDPGTGHLGVDARRLRLGRCSDAPSRPDDDRLGLIEEVRCRHLGRHRISLT
jgi:hypothetical protein